MYADILNIALGFLEGFALIISPCILPILPIFLAGSLTGSKKRPIGIVIGFILIFSLFTFFSRKFIQYSGIDPNVIREFSYGMLILFGVVMLSTYLTDKFAQLTRRLNNAGNHLSLANDAQGGLLSGFLFGSFIAIIWTPCAGPILAAVIVQTVIQQNNFLSFCTILAFGLGAALPLLAIVFFGRQLMVKMAYFKRHGKLVRKSLGVIILLSVAYSIYVDKITDTPLVTPSSSTFVNGLQKQIDNPYPAPAISGIEAWINSSPLEINHLKGKVVLIDFWTYSCINCVRTLPYLKNWYDKYHNQGLVIIGVHSPEFEFEKKLSNVQNAVSKNNINYPVALDNNFMTWRNYSNQYWPAHYLIDKNGNVVYIHFGEGDYDVTENNIRYLLGLNHADISDINNSSFSEQQTPETYLGYARAKNFSSPEIVKKDSENKYSIPQNLPVNAWALQGKWVVQTEKIIAMEKNVAMEINFHAKKVFIVMGNATEQAINVSLTLNGKKIDVEQGKDVIASTIHVDKHSIYSVIDLKQSSDNKLRIISDALGLEIYALTFGD